MKQTKENSKLTFGKYKGWSVSRILIEDPAYIIWANDNVSKERFNPTKDIVHRANIYAAHDQLIKSRDLNTLANFDVYDKHGDPTCDD